MNSDIGTAVIAADYIRNLREETIMPVEEVTLEVGTPKGLFTGTFPETAKVSEVIAAAVDILISAANERNVRSVIEGAYPPLQIYGTTGRNWQAAVIRHAPLSDPCSCCLPSGDEVHRPTVCATGTASQGDGTEKMDAALPFLSFAAGAMAGAEILKTALPGYPFSSNRVILNTAPAIRTVPAALAIRPDCICRHRSAVVHREMMLPAGGRRRA